MKKLIRHVGNRFMRSWERAIGIMLPPNSRLFQVTDAPYKVFFPSARLKKFSNRYGYFSITKPLVGKVTKDLKDIEIVQELLNQPKENELVTAEIITKVLAYRNLWEGLEVTLPLHNAHGVITPIQYRVDRVFDLWKSIPAYGLVPCDPMCSPLLIFRGTQFSPFIKSGRASIISDLDPQGPGRSLYTHAKPQLTDWLGGVTEQKKARVFGYSLGAALAGYILIEESAYFSQNPQECSYLFHLPGIPDDLLESYQKLPDKRRPAFHSYVSAGDLVSKIGHLFGPTTELKVTKPLPPITAHTKLLFAQKGCQARTVDVERENTSFYRQHYTVIHRSTSELVGKFGLKYFFPR